MFFSPRGDTERIEVDSPGKDLLLGHLVSDTLLMYYTILAIYIHVDVCHMFNTHCLPSVTRPLKDVGELGAEPWSE